jgi:hypothetical protein
MYRIPSRMHMYSMQTYISAGIIRILIAFQQFLTLCMYCILYVCVLCTVKILIIPLSAAKIKYPDLCNICSNCVYSLPVFTWLYCIYFTRIYTDKSLLVPLFDLFHGTETSLVKMTSSIRPSTKEIIYWRYCPTRPIPGNGIYRGFLNLIAISQRNGLYVVPDLKIVNIINLLIIS